MSLLRCGLQARDHLLQSIDVELRWCLTVWGSSLAQDRGGNLRHSRSLLAHDLEALQVGDAVLSVDLDVLSLSEHKIIADLVQLDSLTAHDAEGRLLVVRDHFGIYKTSFTEGRTYLARLLFSTAGTRSETGRHTS